MFVVRVSGKLAAVDVETMMSALLFPSILDGRRRDVKEKMLEEGATRAGRKRGSTESEEEVVVVVVVQLSYYYWCGRGAGMKMDGLGLFGWMTSCFSDPWLATANGRPT